MSHLGKLPGGGGAEGAKVGAKHFGGGGGMCIVSSIEFLKF